MIFAGMGTLIYWLERRISALPSLPAPAPGVRTVSLFSATTPGHVQIALEYLFSRDPGLEIVVVAADLQAEQSLRQTPGIRQICESYSCALTSAASLEAAGPHYKADASFLLFLPPSEGGAPPRVRRKMGRLQWASRPGQMVLIDAEGNAWSASASARAARKILAPWLAAIRPRMDGAIGRLIRSRALPDPCAGGGAKIGEGLCAHKRRRAIVRAPRPIEQCEECGIGITPPAWMSSLDFNKILGHQYHAKHLRALSDDAGGAEGLRRYQQRRLDNMRQVGIALDSLSGKRVLDFGCGTGGLADALRGLGASVTACDCSADSIATARLHFSGVQFLVASENLEGVEGEFDLAVLSHVLAHIAAPEQLLRRLSKRLRPGGRIFIEVPWADRMVWQGEPEAWRNIEHFWEFNKGALARLIAGCGYSDVCLGDTCAATKDREKYLIASASACKES